MHIEFRVTETTNSFLFSEMAKGNNFVEWKNKILPLHILISSWIFVIYPMKFHIDWKKLLKIYSWIDHFSLNQ